MSLEVAPSLAHDTEGTIAAARHFHQLVDEPNLYVKIPATAEGVPAIRAMFAEGRNINITLLFSVERYDEVILAYIGGSRGPPRHRSHRPLGGARRGVVLREPGRHRGGPAPRHPRQPGPGRAAEIQALRGTAAVAQARCAYALFTERFSGPRWEALVARGAKVQRPLWASTSTKNPAYPDLLYVDSLIGPDTVNTMPDETIAAFLDHGTVARTVDAAPRRGAPRAGPHRHGRRGHGRRGPHPRGRRGGELRQVLRRADPEAVRQGQRPVGGRLKPRPVADDARTLMPRLMAEQALDLESWASGVDRSTVVPPGMGDASKKSERAGDMKIGMVGLGKMGANMTQRLIEKGHQVVAFDLSDEARARGGGQGAETAATLAEMVAKLDPPRVAWVMVPAGAATTSTIDTLKGLMERGDVVIDGGNSNYKEAAPTAASLAEKGIGFVDAGTSGGVWGLANGYCLMVGGDEVRGGDVRADLPRPRPRRWLRPRGPGGGGPLRQDGPQRHRVRAHAGLRRGLRDHGEGGRVLARPPRDRLHLALRLGRPLLAPRARRTCPCPRFGLRARRRHRRRLRRRPVDARTRRSTAACPRR